MIGAGGAREVETPASDPRSVIRLSLLAWGLGYLALGHRTLALVWLLSEIVAAGLVAYLFIGLADTTWYLVPFVAGVLFLAAWGTQAVLAYRSAGAALKAAGRPMPGSAAAAMAWLTIPVLLWGAGFWLATGSATGPEATLDRFESEWPALVSGGSLDPDLLASASNSQMTREDVSVSTRAALQVLMRLCAQGSLTADCSSSPKNLLRNVRISLAFDGPNAAVATVTVVTFESRSSRFLGIFAATELVPVPRQTLLSVRLQASAAPFPGSVLLGARRWQIVD